MDAEGAFDAGAHFVEVGHEFVFVGVCAEGADGTHFGVDFMLFAEDFDGADVFDESAPEGVFGLVADNEDDIILVSERAGEVVEDTAGFAHA